MESKIEDTLLIQQSSGPRSQLPRGCWPTLKFFPTGGFEKGDFKIVFTKLIQVFLVTTITYQISESRTKNHCNTTQIGYLETS